MIVSIKDLSISINIVYNASPNISFFNVINTIDLSFGEKINFVCSDLKGNDFYILFNDIYMNNSIYNQGQLYSNNQNCKKIDNISYDRYVILNSSARGDIFKE